MNLSTGVLVLQPEVLYEYEYIFCKQLASTRVLRSTVLQSTRMEYIFCTKQQEYMYSVVYILYLYTRVLYATVPVREMSINSES